MATVWKLPAVVVGEAEVKAEVVSSVAALAASPLVAASTIVVA